MADLGWLARLRPRVSKGSALSSAVVIVATGALLAAALDAEGYQTPELELHDAGVWLSRRTGPDGAAIGRFNTQIRQMDVQIESAAEPLLQHDATVWVVDGRALCAVDGRTAKLRSGIVLPSSRSEVDLGGPAGVGATGAILADGELWVAPSDDLLALGFPPATCSASEEPADADPSGGPAAGPADPEAEGPVPTAEVPEATELTVATDGTAWTYAPSTGEVRGFDAAGVLVGEHTLGVVRNERAQLSTVGRIPVVLDPEAGVLHLPGEASVDLGDSTGLVLQLPGPARDRALLASDEGLLEVTLSGGTPEVVAEGGTGGAARPLRLGGCSYGAWAGGGQTYTVACDGSEAESGPLSGRPTGQEVGKELRIRTNRGRVVVNDLDQGHAYLLGHGQPDQISWDDARLEPEPDADDSESDVDSPQPEDEQQKPEARNDTGEPGSGEDAFGTRPGVAVVVHPMRNDRDPNPRDVLVITEVVDDGCECTELVDGGLAVQITPPLGSSEDIRFTYTISDGIDTATAESLVEVFDHSENEPPYYLDSQPQTTTVVAGGIVRHNVLTDARDPEGDALSLVVPVAPPKEDGSLGTPTASVDGTITFTAPGMSGDAPSYVGPVDLPFTISDGRSGGELDAVLRIEVVDPASSSNEPMARGDHALTVVGHENVVDVLANDSDADGDQLRVTYVSTPAGASVVWDERGHVRVTPTQPGPLLLDYRISDGTDQAEGEAKIRIDVLEDAGPVAPLAVRDDVILPAGQVVVVDVLDNDTDANGDVLIVEGVVDADRVGLAVEVIQHRFLRVRSSQALLGPVAFTYSVSDGTARDVATVVVRPGPPGEQQPPTANNDSYRVRAGTIAAFDVLANDTDPEGAPLRLVAESLVVTESSLPVPDGAVFPQDGLVRFAAPLLDEPQSVRIGYTAADDDGADARSASAEVFVTIVPEDEPNGAPRPPELTARTVAGRAVVIPIPVATMDPDGDDVTLLGIADGPDSAPRHGSVTELGNDRLTYLPDQYEGGFHGTDSFTYRVRDAKGLESVGVVRVGVAQPPEENHPPVAIDDERSASGPITIDVRRNDSDPDGDELSLVPDSLVKADPDQTFIASITEGGRVEVDPTSLAEEESATFSYTVTDGIQEATGRVTVTKTDQAHIPPIALDDRAPAAETGEEVEWDVLANDVDPDGAREDLTIEKAEVITGLTTDVALDGGTVRFTMADADVTIRYRVVDGTRRTADAVLRVRWASSTALFPPVAGHDSATTDEGAPVVVEVLENDVVMPDRTPQLLDVVARPNGTCTATPDGRVRYQPDPGFSGLGGCSYVVGDGPGDSPDTLRATGTIGVTVVRTSNAPPRFVAQRITVYADDSTTVDLRTAVVDPDDPKQRQRVELGDPEGEPEGISARIDGTVLTVSADPGVNSGTAELTFTVSDGTDQSEQPGRVLVTVSQFDGPLASLTADEIRTIETEPKAVNVLANDRRAIQDEPLSIVRADERVKGGKVDWKPDGNVTFTPDDGYHGVTSFTYTVDDGTDRPDRQVSATVTVTVIGLPDPPAPPTLVRGDGKVSLSWSTPADNGAPITAYLVEAAGGPGAGVRKLETAATSYTFEGLRNGETYTFRVAAINEAVRSNDKARFSQPTLGIVPNAIPNTPAPPVARFDRSGGAIDVSWANPGTNGSPITEYLLRVDPSSSTQPNPIKVLVSAPGQSSFTKKVDGLVNGTAYTVTVQAVAVKADASTGEQRFESAVSAPSVPEVPATKPGAPTKPVINPADLGDRQITVHWERPAENGDPISQYHVDYFVDGAKVGTEKIPGAVTQTTIQNTDNNKKYTFAVRAENKAGIGDSSPQSDAVNSYGAPGPVASISATEGDQSSVLTFARPPENGAAIDAYQVRAPNLNGGAWTGYTHSTSGTTVTINVGGLTNGTTYQFQVRAHNARDWATDPGATSNAIRPFGIPHAPGGLSGHNNGGSNTLTWDWSGDEAAQRNGHDDIIRWEVEVQNVGVYQVGSPTYSVGVNPGDCRNVRVRAVGDRTVAPNRQVGQWTGFAQACAPAPPPPTAQDRVADAYLGGTCALGDRSNGTWYNSGNCPGEWIPNTTIVTMNCTMQGAAYNVQIAGGTQTWNWWVRLTNGRWIKTAVLTTMNSNGPFPGLQGC